MKSPDSNYGVSDDLVTENRYGHWSHPEYWQKDVLIRFDLSSLPAGFDVTSALLGLYYYAWHDTNPAGRQLTCYRVEDDWDEDVVTWNTRPDCASKPTSASIVPSSPGEWMKWDVTSDVQAFLSNPAIDNYGWQLMDEVPWGTFDIPWTKFRSKEFEEFIPRLTVVPEPATLGLLSAGRLLLMRRRSR